MPENIPAHYHETIKDLQTFSRKRTLCFKIEAMQVQTVSLLGLNRMTGSVGLALKKTLPSLKIVGYDPRIDKKIGKAALQTGVIDNLVSSQREAAKADVPLPRLSLRRD